jgi:hypothetical protein
MGGGYAICQSRYEGECAINRQRATWCVLAYPKFRLAPREQEDLLADYVPLALAGIRGMCPVLGRGCVLQAGACRIVG